MVPYKHGRRKMSFTHGPSNIQFSVGRPLVSSVNQLSSCTVDERWCQHLFLRTLFIFSGIPDDKLVSLDMTQYVCAQVSWSVLHTASGFVANNDYGIPRSFWVTCTMEIKIKMVMATVLQCHIHVHMKLCVQMKVYEEKKKYKAFYGVGGGGGGWGGGEGGD